MFTNRISECGHLILAALGAVSQDHFVFSVTIYKMGGNFGRMDMQRHQFKITMKLLLFLFDGLPTTPQSICLAPLNDYQDCYNFRKTKTLDDC